VTEEAETSLVVLPKGDPMTVFGEPGMADKFLAQIRPHVDAFEAPSAETPEGRAEIKRFAMKVVRSKTYLEEVGAECAKTAKELPKVIDANRKKLRDTLDAWRDEIRAPVTAWEEAEEKRVEALADILRGVQAMAMNMEGRPASELRECLAAVDGTVLGPHLQEFEEEIGRAVEQSRAALTAAISAREKAEAEQAELEALRREKAERDRRDAEERIAREAAEKARKDAEETAAREIEQREAAARAEREAIEARAQAEREAAERRERELRDQAEAAQRQAAETEARVRREAEEAKAAQEAEDQRRAADKEHRRRVNSEALKALLHCGLTEGQAVNVITAIMRGDVPNVTISY